MPEIPHKFAILKSGQAPLSGENPGQKQQNVNTHSHFMLLIFSHLQEK
jgi:hypothetical protein